MLSRFVFQLCLCHHVLSAFPQDGTAGDIIASGSEVQLNCNDDSLSSNSAYIDFGTLALPSAPFTVEARLYWRGQTQKNLTQTFFFYGTSGSFLWIGGVPQSSSSSSIGWLYVVVKNATGVYANPVGSFLKSLPSQTWFVFSASVTKTAISLYLFNWDSNYDLAPTVASTFSFGFDPSLVASSGRSAYVGYAPSSVQSVIQTAVGASGFTYFGGRVDEIRIFDIARTLTDSLAESYQRLGANRANLVALWTIPETTGSTITDSVGGSIGTIIKGKFNTQDEANIMVNAVTQVLPADSGYYDLPVILMHSELITNVAQTTSNPGVTTCYMYGGCNNFPVYGLFDSLDVRSIRFTPSRSVCGTTQVFGFKSDTNHVFQVSLYYKPYQLNVIQSKINLTSTAGGKILLNGTFGSKNTPAATLDNVSEYAQITGDWGTQTLSSNVDSNGLYVTFPSGYGAAQLNINICNQTLTRPVYYPAPVIKSVTYTDIAGWDVFNTFQIHGSHFGPSRATWNSADIIFYNGTTYQCLVQSNNDTFISCQMPQFLFNGTRATVTINIGGLKASYSASFGTTIDSSSSDPHSAEEAQKDALSMLWIIIIAAAGGCIMLLVALMLLFVVIRRRRKSTGNSPTASVEMELPQETPLPQGPPGPYGRFSFGSITDHDNNQGGSSYGARSDSQSNYSPVPSIGILTRTNSAERMILNQNWTINYEEIHFHNEIGKGAFGVVYKAVWKGVAVAVKQMLSELEGTPIRDFFAEAELMTKLRPHPNITQILGVCESPPCIVTEFVHNGSLKTWLQNNAPEKDMMVQIARGIAAGMMYLHSEGVIHRDLAARNILLDKLLGAKVSDFGMSRVAFDNITNKTISEVGPIRWMAPEAMKRKVYNYKTDVWSYGVVLYEIMTRKLPYFEYDLMQVAANVMMGQMSLIPDIEKKKHLYPPVMVTVMKQCLQLNPD
eukprot:CAMPEP_0168564304 /NCGR_PEP_ID=MMETSP0413-20121227/13170_1 /TAXON_ID=136452 /ORGANISM="Filamoeba nolandi, Strain NC-AS-23-1" /LENGTH=949 /DNA_ID=CAMNT_0008595959 /DNA_START=88 /DNA_END=2934 /DNA_ORIENTATION=-